MKLPRSLTARTRAWLTAGAPIVALVLICVGFAVAMLWSFAEEQDRSFARHAEQLVENALEAEARAGRAVAFDYAVWNDAYNHITRRWDSAWVQNNYYSNIADGILIVRPDGTVRHAWYGEGVEANAGALTRAVQSAVRHDLNLGRLLSAAGQEGMVATASTTSGDQLVRIAVAPISPEDAASGTRRDISRPVDYAAVVDVLTEAEIVSLGRDLQLQSLHFARATGQNEQAHAVFRGNGTLIGALVWQRERPGQNAFVGRAGLIVCALLLIGAAALALAVRLVSRHVRSEADVHLAEETSRMKSEFIGAMSHELRTPLNAIVGYAGLIQEEADDLGEAGRPMHNDAARVLTAARHLTRLVNDVLDQSKIDAGKLDIALEDLDAEGAVVELEEVVRPLAQASGNEFILAVDRDVGCVRADPMRLHQCLLNLASNALKFTSNGTVRVRVSRVLDHMGARICFEIADTGIGMSSEELQRLFKPFSQASAAVSLKFGGTGLGLSISRSLARSMGGDITADSTLGEGSVFTLTLPAASNVVKLRAAS